MNSQNKSIDTEFLKNKCIEIFSKYKVQHENSVTDYFEQILSELKNEFTQQIESTGRDVDIDQAWRSRKGHLFEYLVLNALKLKIVELNLSIEASSESAFGKVLSLKKQLEIDYPELGAYIPDADIVLHSKNSDSIFAIFSCKVTLRERVAQSAYWKQKILSIGKMSHIDYFLVTTDEDKVFGTNTKLPRKSKPRAIAESEFDCTYICKDIKYESEKVKNFAKVTEYLESLKDIT